MIRILPLLRVFLLVFALGSRAVLAQDPGSKSFDFEAWENTATRAEDIIENAQASSPALEALRATLADYRSRALALQDANKARIETLQSQLKALGPAPESGVAEAEEVSRRRSELTEQLAKARAPVIAAEEAYRRANGMIGEIDRIIRERLADQFFTLGPSPINPVYWLDAAEAFSGFFAEVRDEIGFGLESKTQMILTRQALPITLFLLLLGVLFIVRAHHWLSQVVGASTARAGEDWREVQALLLSTTRVLLPMLGVWLIIKAIDATGLAGFRGQLLFGAVPMMSFYLFGAFWLGVTLFSSDERAPVFFDLSPDRNRAARKTAILMGLPLALALFLDRLAAQADFPDLAQIVLSFPIVLIAGVLLIRFGFVIYPKGPEEPSAEPKPLQTRLFRLVAQSIVLLGAAGPILAAIGYTTASEAFVLPAIKSLGLLGALIVVYRLLVSVSQALFLASKGESKAKGESEPEEHGGMLPVILGFILILGALPVMALIWGARVSDLREVWSVANEGLTIGESRISISDFLTFAIVFAIGYTATRLVQSTLRSTVLPRTRIDAGGRNALVTGTGYVGLFLAALAAITSAGLNLSSVAIVAGALSVGIGFGLQAIVSNFVSGIILLVERPIKEGDWIEVGAYSGTVRKISVRSTEIETFERSTVVVPNADFISGTVTNYTHSSLIGRVRVPVGVAYDSDPRLVEQILMEIAEAHPLVNHRYNKAVVFMGFGADSMDFEIRAILKDVNNVLVVKSDMNYEIVRRFREAGIEIPFAQRDINLRNVTELGETIAKTLGGKKT